MKTQCKIPLMKLLKLFKKITDKISVFNYLNPYMKHNGQFP